MNKHAVVTAFISVATLSACAPSEVQFAQSSVDLASSVPGVTISSVSQSFEVKANADIDVLFVVDNSGSMDAEQKNFSSKINGFMNLIKDMNWHVALTTTDSNVNTIAPNKASRPWGDGQFRPFDSDGGSLFVLKSNEVSLSDAQTKLAAAINVGLLGSGDERAINSTYRAIERISDTGANQSFFRAGAKLVVIAISDEDECSNGKCVKTIEKSVPANLVNLVHSTFGSDKVFTFDSIVRGSADSACSTAAVAPIYESMAKLTGGILGSVCATDYTSVLSSIGTKAVELVKSINLNCTPVDVDGDGKGDIALFDGNGNRITSGFSVSGTTVSFSANLSEGSYSAKYGCEVQ